MVFAHACKRKGADPDILETLMGYIEVLGHQFNVTGETEQQC